MHTPTWFLTFFLLSVATGLATSLYFWINARHSRRQRESAAGTPSAPPGLDPGSVTALVPVHTQDLELFRRALSSLEAQGCRIVVVGDGVLTPYREMAIAHGGAFVAVSPRQGKKAALATGIDHVETPYVLFVDSDTVMPEGGVLRMLSHFRPGVGGVGANLTVPHRRGWISYCSEFVERSREVVLRAMSLHGNVMLLDGACAMYPTALVAPFLRSEAFLDVRVLGRRVPLGDDWLLTGHVIAQGQRAVKAYDVWVETPAPTTLRGFLSRNVRWARSGWIRLGRDLRHGALWRGGRFFRYEMLGAYGLPLLTCFTFLTRLPLIARRGIPGILPPLLDAVLYGGSAWFRNAHWGSLLLGSLLWFAEMMGVGAFLFAVQRGIREQRGRTMLFGALATGILLATTLYGLLTFWKATEWDRPLGTGEEPRASGGSSAPARASCAYRPARPALAGERSAGGRPLTAPALPGANASALRE